MQQLVDMYTPGLHGCPSTILIGSLNSEPLVSGHTSTSKLSSLASLSKFRADSWFCRSHFGSLTLVRMYYSFVLQHTPLMLAAPWMRVALILGGRLAHCRNNQCPCILMGCPWRVLRRLRIPDLALVWCWCLPTFSWWDSVRQWPLHGWSYLWQKSTSPLYVWFSLTY
jgi:hypothetical protein